MNNESIGALWEKTSAKGDTYLSGTIEINGEKISLVCFKNGQKKLDKHPDWKVLISSPRPSAPKELSTTPTEPPF